jgi:hypothetical protein
MDIPIAIPTYKNCELLKNNTLTYLALYKYPSNLINLFVESEEEAAEYKKSIPQIFYNKIIVANRKSINQHYKHGEIVIQMAENVKDIKSPYLTLNQIILHAKNLLDSNNCGLFGIMPHDCVKGMVDSYSTHLEYIHSYFFICRNHRDIHLTVNEKQDYERTILYFLKYEKVVRYRGAGITIEPLNRNANLVLEDEQKEINTLVSKYPMMCRVMKYEWKTEIMLDIRFKKS